MVNMVWEADDIFYNRRNDFYRVYKGEELYWEKELEGEREYLNFTSIEDGSFIGWVNHDTGELIDSEIYYSYNKDTWTLLDSNGITLNNGDVVYMKSTLKKNNYGFLTSVTKYGTQHFTITGKVNGNGVCTSLVYGDAEVYKMELRGSGNQFYDYENATFQNLFHSCTGLIVAPQIGFSRDSYLSVDCLAGMFYGCSNLISAPKLPYMNLRKACYGGIFYNCTSLVTAPQLPATNLGDYCYVNAFNGCTSLKEMPYLPATILGASAYYSMFEGCTSLVTASELPATILGASAYERMFYGCTSLVTAPPRINSKHIDNWGCQSMFEGCTSLVTAPELPATSLSHFAYKRMFYGCRNLVTAPPRIGNSTDYINQESCESMFEGCTSLVTAPELPATRVGLYAYERMFYGCRSLNYLHCRLIPTWEWDTDGVPLPYTENWLGGVSLTGTFVKNYKVEFGQWRRGNGGIPEGWKVEND